MFSIEDMIRKGFAPLAQAANPADPAIAPHIPFNPQSGTIPASGSLMEREDIRGGSITFMDDHRTLEWRHTVLMDQNTNGGTPSPVALTKDGLFVAVGFEDSVVRVWNVADENPQFMLCQHKDTIQCTAFHPDQQLLASSSADCSIILWDFRKSLCLYQSFDDGSQVLSLMFSPDGKIMMTGSENATIRFWDVESIINGVKEPVITKVDVGQGSAVYSIAFTPDSSRAISCVNNGYIWDPRSGELIHEMVGHEGTIWALAISHNGARAATGSEDNTTRIWSIETGAELVTIREHRGAIWSVQFSQDDRYVVSGSYDSTISISSASTGECFHILSGHSSVVQAVARSPIGDLVASGAADGIVKLWDGKRGKLIAELKGHADKIKSLMFSPNCDDLISSSDDGTVRIWSMVNVFRVM